MGEDAEWVEDEVVEAIEEFEVEQREKQDKAPAPTSNAYQYQ